MKKYIYMLILLASAIYQEVQSGDQLGTGLANIAYSFSNTFEQFQNQEMEIEFNPRILSAEGIDKELCYLSGLFRHGHTNLEEYAKSHEYLIKHSEKFKTQLNSYKKSQTKAVDNFELLRRINQVVGLEELQKAHERYQKTAEQEAALKLEQDKANQVYNNQKRDVDLAEEQANNQFERDKKLENEKAANKLNESKLEFDKILEKNKQDNEAKENRIKTQWAELGKFVNKERIAQVSVATTGIIGGYFVLKHGVKRLFEKTPEFVDKEVSILPLNAFQRVVLRKRNPKLTSKKLFYDKELQKVLNQHIRISKSVIKSQKGKKSKNYQPIKHQHMLMWGKPGTGKTIFAIQVAIEAGFDYFCKIDGASFHQGSLKDFYPFLNNLKKIAKCGKSVLVFFDEADAVFYPRTESSGLSRDIVSAFIAAFPETEHSHIAFMLASNLVEDIDPAVLRRMALKQEVNIPKEKETCYAVLKDRLNKNLKNTDIVLKFSLKDKKDALGDALLGLSQSNIEATVLACVRKHRVSKKDISYESLLETIQNKKKEEEKIEAVQKAKHDKTSQYALRDSRAG